MSMELEQRLAAIERAVTDLHRRLDDVPGVPKRKWWEPVGPPMTPDESKAFDEVTAYGRYFRKAGREAPPDWKPGDPIPDEEIGE